MTILPVVCLFATNSMAAEKITNDTTSKISHVLDGNSSEWKADKFEVDKETGIAFSVDHDADYIYLVVKVKDQAMQMKLMSQGMNLYIDKKGKKREGTGIEFPIKREGGGGFGGGRPRGGDGQGGGSAPNPVEIRERMAATMILLKVFGLDGVDDQQQLIGIPNGVNLAFDWDAADVLCIEYLVPIRFIGSQSALNGKPLGIGWKINGIELSGGGGTIVSQQIVGVPAGGRGGGGGAARGGGNSGASRANAPSFDPNDSRFKEQSFWTKYVISF